MVTISRYVGMPPGTTTIQFGADPVERPVLTIEQYYAEDIALRKKEARWRAIGSIATAGLSTIAIVAAVGAWIRTGRLKAPRKVR